MDAELQALERAFLASQDPGDELAWLQARLRAGQRLGWPSYRRLGALDPEWMRDWLQAQSSAGQLRRAQLALATYCGFPSSEDTFSASFPLPGRAPPPDPDDLLAVTDEILAWEWAQEFAERFTTGVALALAIVLPQPHAGEFQQIHGDERAPRRALEAAGRYLEQPTQTRIAACREAAEAVAAFRSTLSETSLAGDAYLTGAEIAARIAATQGGGRLRWIQSSVARAQPPIDLERIRERLLAWAIAGRPLV